jgi:hypothetical protein
MIRITRTEIPTLLFVLLVAVLLAIMLVGCSTTLNLPVAQPNLQTINLGMPNCSMDCHTTQTATQSIGPGDVDAGSISTSHSTSTSKSVGGGQ